MVAGSIRRPGRGAIARKMSLTFASHQAQNEISLKSIGRTGSASVKRHPVLSFLPAQINGRVAGSRKAQAATYGAERQPAHPNPVGKSLNLETIGGHHG